jgi:hypothetical protein
VSGLSIHCVEAYDLLLKEIEDRVIVYIKLESSISSQTEVCDMLRGYERL